LAGESERLILKHENPIAIFKTWLDEAKSSEINDPDAMALATATTDGKPSVRMVLLKSIDERGFKFHTNSDSQKGQEMLANPYVSLCFHWKSLRKQVRVDGVIQEVDTNEADEYFAGRPYNRQIGAWASDQSSPLDARTTLETRIKKFENQFADQDIPRPPNWKGYIVCPHKIELWFDNPDRLHDRFIYLRDDDGKWGAGQRLYP